ncbi:alpha/beta fold hydrolase [Desulfosporosinus fructosivorans]
MKQKYEIIENENAKLFCKYSGSGPLLVLIHGAMVDSNFYDAAAEVLSQKYTVITYDRRGYSRSTVCEASGFSVSQQARDAASIIKFTGEKQAAVFGASAGGMVALELASQHPELINLLMVHEAPSICLLPSTDDCVAWTQRVQLQIDNGKINKAVAQYLEYTYQNDVRGPKKSESQQQQEIKNMYYFLKEEFYKTLTHKHNYAGIQESGIPAVIGVGELSHESYCARCAFRLAQELNCELIHFPGYHNVAYDLPTDFATMLIGILARYL